MPEATGTSRTLSRPLGSGSLGSRSLGIKDAAFVREDALRGDINALILGRAQTGSHAFPDR